MANGSGNSIPSIDLTPYFDGTNKRGVAQKIALACEDIGFFSISGHGVSQKLIQDVDRLAKGFFDLPVDQKLKTTDGLGMGYIDSQGERLASGLDDKETADKKESLNISLPVSQPTWPDKPVNLDTACHSYYRELSILSRHLMRLFALALGLPEIWFDDKTNPPRTILRLLNYPESNRIDDSSDNGIRAGTHTDYGTLTILWSSDLRGLQAQNRDGKWIDVDAPDDHFVINIGDLMMNWTNDHWISTVHRVVSESNGISKRRRSTAFFHNPNPDAVISCIDTCCSKENPAKYDPILAKDHLEMKIEKSLGRKIKI